MGQSLKYKVHFASKNGKKIKLLAVGLTFKHKLPAQQATIALNKYTDHFVGEFEWNWLFNTYGFRPMWRVT